MVNKCHNLYDWFHFRIQWLTTEWKMFRYVPGKRSMNEVDHHLVRVQRMRYHLVFYGYLIMLCHDAPAAKRNFGQDDGNIIAGQCTKYIINKWLLASIPKLSFQFANFVCCVNFRSCGQIFCADCSEYWAALPDERLFTPVRLCASCYNSITAKCQVSFQIRKIDNCSSISTGRII